MKTCPVCKSRLFDDMDICYGCMYRFEGEDKGEGKTKDKAKAKGEGASSSSVGLSPGKTLSEQPSFKEMVLGNEKTQHCGEFRGGTWSARFDLANRSEPNAAPFTCALTIEIAPAAKGGEADAAGA